MTRSRLATFVVCFTFLFLIGINLRAMYLESSSTATESRFVARRKPSVEPAPERVSIVYRFDAAAASRDAGVSEPDVPDAGKRPALSLSDISDGGEDLFTRLLRRAAAAEPP